MNRVIDEIRLANWMLPRSEIRNPTLARHGCLPRRFTTMLFTKRNANVHLHLHHHLTQQQPQATTCYRKLSRNITSSTTPTQSSLINSTWPHQAHEATSSPLPRSAPSSAPAFPQDPPPRSKPPMRQSHSHRMPPCSPLASAWSD